MALGSGISVSVGGNSGDTVHVNNQPMIVLLVPFRKGGVVLEGGWDWGKGVHINFFFIPVSLGPSLCISPCWILSTLLILSINFLAKTHWPLQLICISPMEHGSKGRENVSRTCTVAVAVSANVTGETKKEKGDRCEVMKTLLGIRLSLK